MELNMTAAEHPSDVPEAAASTEVVAVARRRKFTTAYIQRIVREASDLTGKEVQNWLATWGTPDEHEIQHCHN